MSGNIKKDHKYTWYMISTSPNKEEQVIEALKKKIETERVEEYFSEFKIFYEKKITKKELEKKRNGQEYKVKLINLYKGYIFIKMQMTDETWYITRNTEYVTGLIGSHGSGVKPTPISKRSFQKMKDTEIEMDKSFEDEINSTPFKVGDQIRIVKGELASDDENQIYKVTSVSEIRKSVTIDYELLGKKNSLEIDWTDIEKY
ncbi:transcription termination/antitermination protein NusG [Mycoplasma testudineum]|nr:transcription termination/antitermination protein NusG [Mycoplasma testudineum]